MGVLPVLVEQLVLGGVVVANDCNGVCRVGVQDARVQP